MLAVMLAAPAGTPTTRTATPSATSSTPAAPTSRSSSTTPWWRSIEQLGPADPEVGATRHATVVGAIKRAERWIRRLQRQGVCDDIDPWTTAVALQTMTIRVAYDHLLPQAGAGDRSEDVDVDAMARAVSRIWARTVGLESVGHGGDDGRG